MAGQAMTETYRTSHKTRTMQVMLGTTFDSADVGVSRPDFNAAVPTSTMVHVAPAHTLGPSHSRRGGRGPAKVGVVVVAGARRLCSVGGHYGGVRRRPV